ncbi:MAG TPA: HEXXH motif domain-containing protein [Streptosporangiaceae bacterium]
MLTTHRLSQGDLNALATGRGQAAVVQRLRLAELSKHRILLAALMREAARISPFEYASMLAPAYRLLADVEKRGEKIVRSLLASPQFGGWVSDCVRRLAVSEEAAILGEVPPLWIDLGQLATFACAAALRTGCPFELMVPLRNGAVTFPNLGTAYPGASAAWEWGRACLDANGGWIHSSVSTVRIPSPREASAVVDETWSPINRLVADSAGLRLEVTLDDRDPFLNRYGGIRVLVSKGELSAWRRLMAQAWTILAGGHRPVAAMIASVMQTLVPLARPSPTRSASSTAASAFGAIALSLPEDTLAMAESLTHEFQHAILSAVTDLTPMTDIGSEVLTYAPWRDDARPVGALLQGTFGHYGIAAFWRQQRRRCENDTERLRGDVEFARWRMHVTSTADILADSGVLTRNGNDLVSALRVELATWQADEVHDLASEYADDLNIDHRVRWRLRYLCPDSAAIESLAAAWRRGTEPAVAPSAIGVKLCRVTLPPAVGNVRSYLLTLRYRDPSRFHRCTSNNAAAGGPGGVLPGEEPGSSWVDPADAAFARGEYPAAANGYLRRIAAGDDPDAWAGLALARRRTGPADVAKILTRRPEVVVALYDQLRDTRWPDPDRVSAWLASLDERTAW